VQPLLDPRYKGETDTDVYRRLDGRFNASERYIPENLNPHAQARVRTLLDSQEIVSDLVRNGQGSSISNNQITDMFNSMVEAVPVANEHLSVTSHAEVTFTPRHGNPASTMSDEVISQNLRELEGQFDISGGLDGAMTAEETRRYFEELQSA
jgi:hypothetical protein